MVLHAPAPHSADYLRVSIPAVAGTLSDGVVTPLESVDGTASPVDAVEPDHASLMGGYYQNESMHSTARCEIRPAHQIPSEGAIPGHVGI